LGALSAIPPPTADDAERFEALLDRCERLHAGGLPFDELAELGRLYRAHTARLARLRERDDDPAAIRHLNALCVRAYSFLYVPPPSERSLRALFLERLPEALGRTWRVQVLAWGLLLVGIALGGALAWRDPQSLHAFMPSCGYTPDGIDRLIASPEARADFLGRSAVPATINAFFGSQLFAHNTRVGLLAFATGMLGGVPTVLLHLYNGIVLGAFAAIFLRDPLPLAFLAWILPHGIPELTAITLCAAAGLCLGGAVAAPGRQGRRQALREAVNPALLLFTGSLPLFALAALAESFVRESTLGTAARLGIAAIWAAGLVASLLAVRRFSRRVPVDAAWLGELIAPVRDGSPGSGSAPRP
jgi:uncharacterized membrane protein SpoIIM required for sporulation